MNKKLSDKLNAFTRFFDGKIANKKKINIILILGIVGILLIAISDFDFSSSKANNVGQSTEISVDDYTVYLENKVKDIISNVDGAGKAKVMITIEASGQRNFATNDLISQDLENKDGENRNKSESEKEIVMIEDENGTKQALIENISEPQIRGVLVLCEGADNPEINEKITNAVKTLLGISSNKISVLKIK